MQAKIKKLGEDRYVLIKETDGKQVAVPMKEKQIRALVLEVLYGPRVDQLLEQADEELARQQELDLAITGDSGEMASPSPPAKSDDDFELQSDDLAEKDEKDGE